MKICTCSSSASAIWTREQNSRGVIYILMGKKGDFSDFERDMVVCARHAGLRISETADLLGFSRTTICRSYRKDRTHLVWSDVSQSLLQHSDRVRIWHKQCESMDLSCRISIVQAAVGVMVRRIFSWHNLGPLVRTEHRFT